jgi:hypothetical protein
MRECHQSQQSSPVAALAASGAAPDWTTDAMILNVAAQQLRDGRWHVGGIARPPVRRERAGSAR